MFSYISFPVPRCDDLHFTFPTPLLHHGPRALSAAACYALRRKAHNESMRKIASSLLRALSHNSPPKGGHCLNPTYWMGWVLLAHGETVGHGALRHKNAPPLLHPRPSGARIYFTLNSEHLLCYLHLPHIAPTGPSALRTALSARPHNAKKSAPFLGGALLQSRSEPNDYFLQQSPLSIADNIQMAFSCSAINPVRRSAVAASFASKLVRRVRSSSRRKL